MEEMLKKILELIPAANAGMITSVAVILDFILRMIPTKKPLSILHLAAASLHLIGAIASKAAALLDAVLPQRVIEKKE